MRGTVAPLDIARDYCQRGWSVVPVPYRGKNPGDKTAGGYGAGWQKLRLLHRDLPDYFNGRPMNVGVLLGEPSGGLVDIDLDHPIAVEIADQYLPPTACIFGRASKPKSHRLYRVNIPIKTVQHRLADNAMIIELRSTGGQTVFPGSTHESGEPIEWEDPAALPAVVEIADLTAAVEAIVDEVRRRLNQPERKPKPARKIITTDRRSYQHVTQDQRLKRCLAYLAKLPNAVSGSGGHTATFQAACECVRFDLDSSGVKSAMDWYNHNKCEPAWAEHEIEHKISEAEQKAATERGCRLDDVQKTVKTKRVKQPTPPPADAATPAKSVALGQRDPVTGKLVLSAKRTLPTAQAYVRDFHTRAEGVTLVFYAGSLLAWRNNRYAAIEDRAATQQLHPWLHDSLRYHVHKDGSLELVPFEANPSTVNAALESAKSHVHLPASVAQPSWLDGREFPLPSELLSTPSENLHVPTGQHHEPTPALFATNAIDFEFDPNAEPPERWIKLLEEIWGDDIESVQTLQEWLGYLLVADTSQQKMLLLVGPRRSGKGTIGRVISRLVGIGNVAGPTTSSLAGNFGLQPLLGKSVAIISDARFTGDSIGVVVERLLAISGEDTITVDQKFLGSVTTKLPTRFVFLTNELPRMNDASGALAGRFIVLRMVNSFYGREDPGLTAALMDELPGILLWAIAGLKRLRQRGHFIQPASVADAIRELEDLSSPIGAFVRDYCIVAKGRLIPAKELFTAWQVWCKEQGRDHAGTVHTFGRDLRAAVPGIEIDQKTIGMERLRVYEGIDLHSAAKDTVTAAKMATSAQSGGNHAY